MKRKSKLSPLGASEPRLRNALENAEPDPEAAAAPAIVAVEGAEELSESRLWFIPTPPALPLPLPLSSSSAAADPGGGGGPTAAAALAPRSGGKAPPASTPPGAGGTAGGRQVTLAGAREEAVKRVAAVVEASASSLAFPLPPAPTISLKFAAEPRSGVAPEAATARSQAACRPSAAVSNAVEEEEFKLWTSPAATASAAAGTASPAASNSFRASPVAPAAAASRASSTSDDRCLEPRGGGRGGRFS